MFNVFGSSIFARYKKLVNSMNKNVKWSKMYVIYVHGVQNFFQGIL